ncbi:MAG: zinc-binding dehydrogenase [Oscillospiraceae bacterium]|nr:zinc-binding dehydrogenase [Oscillospiraceae bacterium]
MKVIKAFGPRDLRVVETPVPEPGPGHVRVKVRASGICGSDKWLWSVKGKTESVAGHEIAGEVDKLGEGVTAFSPGDRVMVNNVVGCGACPACRAGEFVLCPFWNGSQDVNNGFGEYVAAPTRNCMRLLPGFDFIDGSLIMDNWGTPYGALQRVGIKSGFDVLVNGCGPIGQAAVALCAAMGAYVIAAEPLPYRRETALRNGAKAVFSPEELPEAAKKMTNGAGVHTVLECSGNGKAYANCLNSLRIGGNLVSIGEHAEFSVDSSELIRRRLSIGGSWYSAMWQAGEFMQLAAQKRIDLRCFLTHTVKLDEVPEIFGSVVGFGDGLIKCMIVFD